ncbi:MAG: ATPase [Bacteroidales bacterium]
MIKIIVAESGSTKTKWMVIDKTHKKIDYTIVTTGINPFFMQAGQITKTIRDQWDNQIDPADITKVFFYGAGCSTKTKCELVKKGLSSFFKSSKVYVNHDLLAAAKALLGEKDGIAAILGTGSNSCLYINGEIRENVYSLGYFFGDEGSGAHIGKMLIKNFLKDRLPADLHNAFMAQYTMNKEQILDRVYNKPNPNRFLAKFAIFAGKHLESEYMQKLVFHCFSEFFSEQIMQYSSYKKHRICFTGSVAYHFRDILEKAASHHGLSISSILQNPAEKLAKYHIDTL